MTVHQGYAVTEARRMNLDDLKLARKRVKRRVPTKIDSGCGDNSFSLAMWDRFTVRSSNVDAGCSDCSSRRLDEQSLQPASTFEQLLVIYYINATERSADSAAQGDLLNSVTEYHPHLDPNKLGLEFFCYQNITLHLRLQISFCGSRRWICARKTHASVYTMLWRHF